MRRRTVGSLLLGAYLVVALVAALRGESIDPTDPSNYYQVRFRNPTGATLWVRELSGPRCREDRKESEWYEVGAGRAQTLTVAWGGSGTTSWASSARGPVLSGSSCVDVMGGRAGDVRTVLLELPR